MRGKDVDSAFEILLEEIENILVALNKDFEKSLKSQNYEKVKILSENAAKLTEFRGKVKELQKEWKNIFSGKLPKKIKKRSNSNKLRRDLKTPEKDYMIPILESLIELNGKAKMKEVLQKVYIKMKNCLNEYDKEPLPSNSNQIRWENTARWCRNTLVKEGLLSSESPRGIWEITDLGREYFRNNKN